MFLFGTHHVSPTSAIRLARGWFLQGSEHVRYAHAPGLRFVLVLVLIVAVVVPPESYRVTSFHRKWPLCRRHARSYTPTKLQRFKSAPKFRCKLESLARSGSVFSDDEPALQLSSSSPARHVLPRRPELLMPSFLNIDFSSRREFLFREIARKTKVKSPCQ